MSIVYDAELIKLRGLFEKVTRTTVKDCFYDSNNKLTYVVDQGMVRKALGPKNVNLFKFQDAIKKKIRIIEYNADVEKFIRNVYHPLTIAEITEHGEGVYILSSPNYKARGLLIGRNAANLRNVEALVKRFFPIKELKIQ